MAPGHTGTTDLRRELPALDRLLRDAEVVALGERFGRGAVVAGLRELLEAAREAAGRGDAAAVARLREAPADLLREHLHSGARPSLVSVVNATGVVLHTNLGRAPLSAGAAARLAETATTYSNLEFDLATGRRGRREAHVVPRLRALLGAEAAAVVNNNAAAVLLAVNTFAEGREVLVSRGELVEIGGSFRIPDVLAKGGARLREVGTTNRTRIGDYRAALGSETGLILRVHPSNFKIVGFTEGASREELSALAREAGLPLVEDLGSGQLDPAGGSLRDEPAVRASLAAGVDVATFSGDKLLGGPQAGLVVGTQEAVAAMTRNPLYRALRVDKLTLATLDEVLAAYAAGEAGDVPVRRMLALRPDDLRPRVEGLTSALTELGALRLDVLEGVSAVGGGAAPVAELPTLLLAVSHEGSSAEDLRRRLREGDPPVVGRILDDRLVLDLRTVLPEQDATLVSALRRVAGQEPAQATV